MLNIVTLGCSKNLVDSEHLAGRVAAAGWDVLFDCELDCFEGADAVGHSGADTISTAGRSERVVVVNTCGFIGDAKQESIDTILALSEAKGRGEFDRLYVIGCLSERYADELRAELPEVDAFFGARDIEGISHELGVKSQESTTKKLRDADFRPVPAPPTGRADEFSEENSKNSPEAHHGLITHDSSLMTPCRKLSTPPHYAYLKISEGCDRRCGFCAIPLIRGSHRSVPMEELLAEARYLAAQGVKELIVIAQDTTYWGLDLYGERRLAELLRGLASIEGIEWIRLHYAYPAGFPHDVVEVMRAEPKVCKYLDIPLQHIADGQLRSMKRGLGAEGTRRLVDELRAAIPGLALRTTMLVGYPGETERDFEELLEFVRTARFERLGVFPYSAEEGTFSGDELADDVPEDVKQARVDRLMELQAGISAEFNRGRVGRTERVIVDRWEGPGGSDYADVTGDDRSGSGSDITGGSDCDTEGSAEDGGFWVCRSQWDSPEVDTEILVAAPADALSAGQFVDVRITAADEYDLFAEPI